MNPTAQAPTLSKSVLAGALAGLGLGVVLLGAMRLSPLAALDRRALGLIALSLALPVGAMLAFAPANLRQAGLPAFRALACALTLSLSCAIADPRMAAALVLWLAPAMLIGACLGSLDSRGATGLIAAALWLALCALPFFFHIFEGTACGPGARQWALQGCPWLGFAQANLSMDPSRPLDPLRQDILYMGHWSALSDEPAGGLLSTATLWWMAVLALAAALARRISGTNPGRLAGGTGLDERSP